MYFILLNIFVMINKKLSVFVLSWLLGLSLFMVGCDSEGPNVDNKKLPNNEVTSVMKRFADAINLNYSNIDESSFDWYNYSEIDYENYSERWYYTINWYSLDAGGVKSLPNTNEIFDWWYVYYIWDEPWWAAIEYAKDNVVCYYYQSLEQEVPYDLLAWEWDYENEEEVAEYNKGWSDFYATATYWVELNCGYLPEWTMLYKDFYLDAQWQEPFWFASIRWSLISVFNPDGMEELYAENILVDWDNITFKWYSVDWTLEKVNCVDGWVWENHEYKISFDSKKTLYWDDGVQYDVESTHYEGCADKVDLGFVSWEEGTLSNFMKKTGYEYKRNFGKDKVFYAISEIVDRYMDVNIYEIDWDEYDSYQIIMENVDGEWRVLFEGDWYEISPDECEELNQYDNNLMDMFFLRMCPRG